MYMRKFFLPLIVFSVFWISCGKENDLYEIGNDDIDVRTEMAMIDTFSIKSYTVILDSIPTSNVGAPVIITGSVYDELFGTVQARSYFRFHLPSKVKTNSYDIVEDAVFDSLRFFMVYNGYYEGDTTVPFTLSLHRLKDQLKANTDGYFFNNDSVPAYDEPLGSITFRPSPQSKDTLWITLDYDLGREFFIKMRDGNNQLMENDLFQDYFKGVTLRGSVNNQAMLGFIYSSNKVGMRLYYHYFNLTTIKKRFDFVAQVTDRGFPLQFNSFKLSNPKLQLPESQKQKLPVSVTNNQSYILSGIGILTRLEIPYLKNLRYLGENIRVVKAELIIKPVTGTYKTESIPDSLSLNETNNSNIWGSPVYDRGIIEVSNLTIDRLYEENTKYTLDITSFVSAKLSEQSDVIPAMLLHITGNKFYKSVERVVLGSEQHPENDIKLKVYYINVK